jgi:hypothetical protein
MQGRPQQRWEIERTQIQLVTSPSSFAATWLAESRSVVGPLQKRLCSHHGTTIAGMPTRSVCPYSCSARIMDTTFTADVSLSADGKLVLFVISARNQSVQRSISRDALERHFWLPAGANEFRPLKAFADGRPRIMAAAERRMLRSGGATVARLFWGCAAFWPIMLIGALLSTEVKRWIYAATMMLSVLAIVLLPIVVVVRLLWLIFFT